MAIHLPPPFPCLDINQLLNKQPISADGDKGSRFMKQFWHRQLRCSGLSGDRELVLFALGGKVRNLLSHSPPRNSANRSCVFPVRSATFSHLQSKPSLLATVSSPWQRSSFIREKRGRLMRYQSQREERRTFLITFFVSRLLCVMGKHLKADEQSSWRVQD